MTAALLRAKDVYPDTLTISHYAMI